MKRVIFTIIVLLGAYGWLSGQNLALNNPASASTEIQSASNAVDGNSGTRWESVSADPQWITIDLGMSYDIGQVVLNWEGAYGKEYTIQISTDSITWDTLYTETNSDGGIDDISVSGTGRYIKMHGTVRGTPWGYSLWEMEVYEAIDPTEDATLSDLAVDGVTVDGFSPSILTYNVGLPFGTTAVPAVTATTSQLLPASAVVSNAAALPGAATVVVTAQDGVTQLTYTVNLSVDLLQMDLPVTFDDSTVNYATIDFGGTVSTFTTDPIGGTNQVVQTTKENAAATWAGTVLAAPGAPETALASAIPFTANATQLSAMVYAPAAGITVMMKLEDQTNSGIWVETQATTVSANAWDTLVFDFGAPSNGSLNLANTYDKVVMFFDFGNPGAGDVFYWDNVAFVPEDTTVVVPVDSISAYCATYTTHFNIPAEVSSSVNLTITNIDATSMFVEIESANADPVDILLVTGGSGATISAADTTVLGKISRTLTWPIPPTDVSMNILWSKASFGGNWMLSQADITVPFIASCANAPIPLAQMDLPVTFDDTTVAYGFIDFGGNVSQFVTDPMGGANQVVETTKGVASETWAGTVLATAGPPEEGFANAVPFTAAKTKMRIKVYSPTAGTPVLLKLEDGTNSGIFVETQDTTSMANAWETLTFDFSAATGGSLNLANTYDKAVVFFDFGASGNGEVYYWDDVEFVDSMVVVPPTSPIFTDFDQNENVLFSGWPNAPVKVANPNPAGINASDSVGCWARGGEQWAHMYSTNMTAAIDFTSLQAIELKVHAPIACAAAIKLESTSGAGAPIEVVQNITAVNTWEQLSFNFSGTPSGVYDKIIIFLDFAAFGTDTFYFDDVQLGMAVLDQIDMPVDFESTTVNYSLTDFGGNITTLIADPASGTNTVAMTTKEVGAQVWAGTTIGTNDGFANAIPFTALDTKISVKVYSPAAGLPIRLKVEDYTNNTITCETETSTSVANAWETLEFDFNNPVSGTAALNLANSYNMASIFFDFGAGGSGSIFYWDDVQFAPFMYDPISLPIDFESVQVDYSFEVWGGAASELAVDPVDPANTVGKTTKTAGSATWAGTAPVGNANGLDAPIPFSATDTKMKLRVYSPAIGTTILFKVEDKNNGANVSEVSNTTTVANAWETIEFDFANGTPALDLSWTYDKIALFFGFNDVGAGEVFYWDDVEFIETIVAPVGDIINDFDDNRNVDLLGWPNYPTIAANPSAMGINSSDSCAMFQRSTETWANVFGNMPSAFDFSVNNTFEFKVFAPYSCEVVFKLEDQSGANSPVEILDTCHLANEWVQMSYNFSGLAQSGQYDKFTIFLDFATNTDTVFYVDDIMFVPGAMSLPIDLPLDFEVANMTYSFVNFGGTETVLGVDPVDPLNTVAISTKTPGAQTWAGCTVGTEAGFANPIPFSAADTRMSVKVYSPAVGIPILFKLEVATNTAIAVETQMFTTVANAWETIEFDFSNDPSLDLANDYNKAVLFFDFGAAGTGSVFYWDDMFFISSGLAQIDLPVTFESAYVDYSMIDFGGTSTVLGADPITPTNTVAITTKDVGAQTWAGVICGTDSGFVSPVPFSQIATKLSMDVYSPAAGLPIVFKLEVDVNTSVSVETQSLTTVANAWETIEFDFANEVAGTAALDLANDYNKAAIFFDFGTVGNGQVFYWDNIQVVPPVMSPLELPLTFDDIQTDYSFESWGDNITALGVDPVDSTNQVAMTTKPMNAATWAGSAPVGISGGLENEIPFTAEKTRMKMKVYSPAIGIPILFKVEDKNNGANACETMQLTTVANAWETIEFDFANEQAGTPALDTALVYNKIAIFFNFGNSGAGNVYYWDDVEFINTVPVVYDIQTLNLVQGWSIISSYIYPLEASLDSVFASIESEVTIVKNGLGLVYWPAYNLNAIGNLNVGEGYQAKLLTSQVIDIVGSAAVPELTPISMNSGWSIIGYLRNTPADAEIMFSSIINDLTIVKNGVGLVYWPLYNLNAIGNLIPGQGYQIKVTNAVSLVYPANGTAPSAKTVNLETSYFKHNINTGENMTIGFPADSWGFNPTIGDEIAAFDNNGNLVGSTVYANGFTALTVWGKASETFDNQGADFNESLTFKYYSATRNIELPFEIERWISGSNTYLKNGISVAGAVIMENSFSVQAYPNPAINEYYINVNVAEETDVVIEIYNTVGVLVEQRLVGASPALASSIKLNTSSYPSGTYFLKVWTGADVKQSKFQVIE